MGRKQNGALVEQRWQDKAIMAEDHYANAVRYYLEGDKETAMGELDLSLKLRPDYLEVLELREKINRETEPDAKM